jgi:hypothetical protein
MEMANLHRPPLGLLAESWLLQPALLEVPSPKGMLVLPIISLEHCRENKKFNENK